jgi:hypothetical protein
LSVVCESFGCTPAEAEAQDWPTVQAILDYRAALAAREAFNHADKRAGFEYLRAHPNLIEILALMSRAQQGRPLSGATEREGLAVAQHYRTTADED